MMSDIDVVSHVDEVILKTTMALARALEQAGAAAEGHAKDLCPVDTGALRNSITHQTISRMGSSMLRCSALRNSITHQTDLENLTEIIGSNEEYAAYVELGTGVYYKGGRKTPWTYQDNKGQWHITKGQRAQPYLKPAAANYAKEYTSIIADELKGAME